jgi:hypothetical protein
MPLFTFSNIHVQQGCAVNTCSDKLGVPANRTYYLSNRNIIYNYIIYVQATFT